MSEVNVKVDGRPRGADYVRGTGDLMEDFTTTDTTEYGNQYVDQDEGFLAAIGAAPEPEPDTDDGDDVEETTWFDEVTGEELTWDELTEDEQEQVYAERLDQAAAEVQEAQDDEAWETLVERFPRLDGDEQFQDEFADVAEGVAIHLEASWDLPGAASGLLQDPDFLARVAVNEFGLQARPDFIELWEETQANKSLWEAG